MRGWLAGDGARKMKDLVSNVKECGHSSVGKEYTLYIYFNKGVI